MVCCAPDLIDLLLVLGVTAHHEGPRGLQQLQRFTGQDGNIGVLPLKGQDEIQETLKINKEANH